MQRGRKLVGHVVPARAPRAEAPPFIVSDTLYIMEWDASSIGRFQVERVLGTGGMGVVLRAFDPQLQRAVAIKVLNDRAPVVDEGTTLDLRAERGPHELLAEARVLAQIADPNVLAVHEIGTDGGRTFLVMELVDGVDLRSWLDARKRTLAELRPVFVQAGRGLAAAHRRGVIHRDFKPENVLVSPDGNVRVADFGIAALQQPTGLVRLGTAGAGTPRYMAPELWHDAPATTASDTYAFATTLAEAILGGLPDDRDARLRVAVDARLRTAITRALDPDPAKRATLDELIDALDTKPRGWLPYAIGATAVAAIGIGVALAAVSRDDRPTCGDANELLVGRWDDGARAAIRDGLATIAASDLAPQIIERIDQYAIEWARLRGEVCKANVPADRRAAQLSCLDRRLFDLGSVAYNLKTPINRDQAISRSKSFADLGPCLEAIKVSTIPKTAAARKRTEALTARTMAILDKALADQNAGDQAALQEMDREAEKLGDIALVVRIRQVRGQLLGNARELPAAIAVLDSAYEIATKHGLDLSAATSLVESARLSMNIDIGAAERSLKIARTLIDAAPDVSPQTRVRLLRMQGQVRNQRGDQNGALEAYEQAAIEAERVQPRSPFLVGQLFSDRAHTLLRLGRYADALVLAQKSEAELRPTGKAGFIELGRTLATIANIYFGLGQYEESGRIARERIALYERYHPPHHSDIVLARGDYGGYLQSVGKHAEAVATFERVIEQCKTSPDAGIVQFIPQYHGRMGLNLKALGQIAKARARMTLAIDEARKQFGERDPRLGVQQLERVQLELEERKLDVAEALIEAAEVALANADADSYDRMSLAGAQIRLRIMRGRFADAAKLARDTIAMLVERSAPDAKKEQFWVLGAWARSELGEFREARALAERAVASRQARKAGPGAIASAELEVAIARHGLGEAAAAKTIRALLPKLVDPLDRTRHQRAVAWAKAHRISIK
jgi:tetratricopeptide (TPR) repeat protein